MGAMASATATTATTTSAMVELNNPDQDLELNANQTQLLVRHAFTVRRKIISKVIVRQGNVIMHPWSKSKK